MTPVFSKAVSTIAGPFKVFGDTIIKTLGSPQVASSIQAVANAFGKVMTAFTPDIPGIINSFADAIERIANAVAKNPKAYADFLNFFFQVGIMILNGIAFLTDFANYVEQHFIPAVKHFADFWVEVWKAIWQNTIGLAYGGTSHLQKLISGWLHNLAHYYDVFRHGVAQQWDLFWQDTIGRAIRAQAHLEKLISGWLHDIAHWFDVARHDVAATWDDTWQHVVNTVSGGATKVMNLFHTLKTNITNWFHDAINWLVDAGKNIISGMFNGIKNAMSNIGSWIHDNVVTPLIKAVKHFFGISSPASMMVPVGASLIEGVFKGMFTSAKDLGKFMVKVFGGWPEALAAMIGKSFINVANLPSKALHALGGVAGKIGGFFANIFKGGPAGAGVARWASIAKIALMLNNLPDSMVGQVLFQMQTESGGNPNAINLWDINAQRGDPSRGLMQVIGGTFAAYHVPGTSNNIYDPLANIAAAINYAKHVYGPSLMRGGMGLGSGHGYDQGGWLPPGASVAYNLTGRPELVLNHEQLSALSRGGDGSTQYIAHFDSLTGAAIEAHVRTAFQAMSLTQGNLNRQGRRS
jgi:SLT domain-containing protein